MKKRYIEILRRFSIPLILGLAASELLANLSPNTYQFAVYHNWLGGVSLHFLVNDVFMAFFFAIAVTEVVQATKPGGGLNPARLAINPIVSSIGGVVFPMLIFLLMNAIVGSPDYIHGFGIPTATDIALSWLFIRAIFGAEHPAVKFLLVLAIVDDIIGLVIIALFYPDSAAAIRPLYLLLTAAGMVFAYILRRNRVNNYCPYVYIGGLTAWIGLFLAHVHPALALCFVIPFIPSGEAELKRTFIEDLTEKSPLAKFERRWRPIVDFGLFFFGFVSAGIRFSQFGTVTVLVLVALIIGKPLGIMIFSSVCSLMGFRRHKDVSFTSLFIVGMAAGVGFTVSLFICESAFAGRPDIANAAKMGALLSVFGGFLALAIGKLIRKKAG